MGKRKKSSRKPNGPKKVGSTLRMRDEASACENERTAGGIAQADTA